MRWRLRAKVWGCRGSLASPGPETIRYGGNTSCLEVTLESGATVILDAGTGIRTLGLKLAEEAPRRIDILLTHLHLDHLEGLGFFGPLWNPSLEIHIWGPASATKSLEQRIGMYLSPPLFPVHLRELPSNPTFHDVPPDEWRIGRATVSANLINHPNVVDIFEYGELPGGVPYLVMEMLEGRSLSQRLAEGPMPLADALVRRGDDPAGRE